MDLKEVLFSRRSQRSFSDYYVTDQELFQLMEAARFAPSWCNSQCWEFVIVRKRELIHQITETFSSNNPARSCSFSASALIVAIAKKNLSGCREGIARTQFQEWFLFDVGSAVQNIQLMAHDLGLGAVVVGSMDHRRCNEILNIPDSSTVIAVLPVGKPVSPVLKPPGRKHTSDFVYQDVYGNKLFME